MSRKGQPLAVGFFTNLSVQSSLTAGAGGAILRHLGFSRYAANPAICNNCIKEFQNAGVTGAEIPVTLLFADVRGSTGIAEGMKPAEFRAFLDGLPDRMEAILDHDGIVDKLVGDEVIGLFFGGVTGPMPPPG
jgi:adenylate cyclase